jgi:hypothetical protein
VTSFLFLFLGRAGSDQCDVLEEAIEEELITGAINVVDFDPLTGNVSESAPIQEEVCTPIGANITAKFTKDFIDNYEYEHSRNYHFALKVNGWYYNVYRNEHD